MKVDRLSRIYPLRSDRLATLRSFFPVRIRVRRTGAEPLHSRHRWAARSGSLGFALPWIPATLSLSRQFPALANIGTNGGSIAQIASGNGWQTTFVLVNAGAVSAQAHLKFFADNGSPLSLPIGFPQSGGGATTVASAVDQTLAAGATLLVESVGLDSDPAPTIGSAQLTTNGNIGGFVIFRYNPNGQEAVVPLESRGASASCWLSTIPGEPRRVLR